MLSEHEQQRFEQVCLEHIWAAVGMHVLCSASGSDTDARSAATSVRDLVNIAPAYRACWERVKPIVRSQGFRSFVSIVDSSAPHAERTRHLVAGDAADQDTTPDAPTRLGLTGEPDQKRELAAQRLLSIDTREQPASPDGRLRVLEGKFAGRELELHQVLTEFGQPGQQTAAILRQKNGYSIVSNKDSEPDDAPQVNGTPIGSRARILKDNDIVQIAGIKARFMLN